MSEIWSNMGIFMINPRSRDTGNVNRRNSKIGVVNNRNSNTGTVTHRNSKKRYCQS